jgi:hypothetical protein
MTKPQELAVHHLLPRASRYRKILHKAQRCSLDKDWQRPIWDAKENCIIDATILAPELFRFSDDGMYPGMVCVRCLRSNIRLHFPERKIGIKSFPALVRILSRLLRAQITR